MIETVFVPADTDTINRDHWYWWLQTNDNGTWTAPTINNGEPYLPNVKQQWLRDFFWFCRNPAGHFVGAVIGVSRRGRWVTGPAPVKAVTAADLTPPGRGWRWAYTRLNPNSWLGLPFVSYYGLCEFYLGWRPHDGALGFKLVNASRGEN